MKSIFVLLLAVCFTLAAQPVFAEEPQPAAAIPFHELESTAAAPRPSEATVHAMVEERRSPAPARPRTHWETSGKILTGAGAALLIPSTYGMVRSLQMSSNANGESLGMGGMVKGIGVVFCGTGMLLGSSLVVVGLFQRDQQ